MVADFLASRKPYAIADARGYGRAVLAADFPSTRGGYVVAEAGNLAEVVADARGLDSLADERETLADYFLGSHSEDAIERFADEVDAACDRAATERTRARS